MLHPRKDYDRIQDPEGKIPEDEPVFILRAQDVVAADIVRYWAAANLRAGGDPQLSEMASKHADKMDAWPIHKLADVPEEKPEQQGNQGQDEESQQGDQGQGEESQQAPQSTEQQQDGPPLKHPGAGIADPVDTEQEKNSEK